jgi:pSer/pThr/pTyr-binding forkhead associated (FHA) protein
VGRSEVADLTLQDPLIAGIHLKFVRQSDVVVCHDVSGLGYELNGAPGPAQAPIRVGDVVKVGSHALQFISEDGLVVEAAAPTAPPATAGNGGSGSGGPALQALQGNDVGKSFPLEQQTQILGRGVATDITIWDIRASRAHCRLDQVEGGVRLTDLHSSNGTFLNGKRMTAPHLLRPGDLIRIGSTVLKFTGPSGPG